MIEPSAGFRKGRFRLSGVAWRRLKNRLSQGHSSVTLGDAAAYRVDGALNSFLLKIQSKVYADALESVTVPAPVIVIGFWRSGTTLLHELLCCDQRFGYPSTYACLNPCHFLLSEQWLNKRARPEICRPMDDVRYSWSSPQEDEFALLALGAPSPYEAILMPSLMRDVTSLLDPSALTQAERENWVSLFLSFLKLLTIQQNKPMVLKSPTHGFRMTTLLGLFPQARYLIIERNPYEVFMSNLKLWRTLVEKYGLELCTEEDIENFVLSAYTLHEEKVSAAIRGCQPKFVSRVRYENLEGKPMEVMDRLYEELALGYFDAVRPRIEAYLQKVSSHKRNQFKMSAAQKELVEERWGSLIQRKEYGWPDLYIHLQ